MQIQNGYILTIKIDGKDLFSEFPCEFLNANIYESIEDIIPYCTIDLGIHGSALKELPFVDGSKIEINIQQNESEINNTYNFRLYNIESIKQTNWILIMRLSGLLDFYDGYKPGNTFNAFNNTSEIFNNISNQYKLTAKIDQTNDKQLWIAGESNLYQFMTYMTQHAYIDEKSAMFWCFDGKKNLIYKNIIGLFNEQLKDAFTFVQAVPFDKENKIYRYISIDARVKSGENNLQNHGYGGDDYYFDLLDYNTKAVNSKYTVAESRMLNISKELSQGLSAEILPFNVGNFHEKYFTAEKQNKRTLSTFSTEIFIGSDCLQSFNLADVVKLIYMDSGDEELTTIPLSGNYLLSGIHTIISKHAIVANARLIGQGLNTISPTVETY